MENEIKIKTGDRKIIYGTLAAVTNRNKNLVIFVHGFLGNRNQHIIFNGAKYLTKRGFDTFRFDFYSGEKRGRHFRDTKISVQGEDLNTVIKYFKDKYKNIYLVGHSYGGTTLLFAESLFVKGMMFWDASYIIKKRRKEFPYNNKYKSFVVDWGYEAIVGKGFVDELKDFPDCGKLIEKIKVPVAFITAGKRGNEKAGQKYFAKANKNKLLINIKTADHNFDGFNEEERLLDETCKWLKSL